MGVQRLAADYQVGGSLRTVAGLCWLLIAGCTGVEETGSSATLATVGDIEITSDDLDRVAERFGTDGASDTKAWRHSLQLLIDKLGRRLPNTLHAQQCKNSCRNS